MESVQTPASSSPNAVQTPPPVKKRGKLFKVFKYSGIFLAILCLVAAYLLKFQMTHHMEPVQAPAKVEASGDETLDGIRKGIEFLRVYQEDDGGFSRGIVDPKPAFKFGPSDSFKLAEFRNKIWYVASQACLPSRRSLI